MSDKIWIKNIEVLYEPQNLTDFFPIKNQSRSERLNSLVRLSAYISLALVIYHNNVKYSLIFVFILFLTWALYNNNPTQTQRSRSCTQAKGNSPAANAK